MPDPGRREPVRAGDVLVGRTASGEIVRAPIRRASAIGPEPWIEERTRVDLEGATHVLADGFAIRDLGGDEPLAASAPDPRPFRVSAGSSDCSLALDWPASSTPHDVALAVRPVAGHLGHGAGDPSCERPLASIGAAQLAAIASLGEDARVVLELSGDAISCDAPYAVTRCTPAGAPLAEREALAAIAAPACLAAGTPIAVPGGEVAIETLVAGDVVESFDVRRGRGVRATVLGLETHEDRELVEIALDDGTVLEATPEHLMIVGERHAPTRVEDLARGDVLWAESEGTLVARRVASLRRGRRATVHELRVTAPDTYFARGVLTHND